ADAMEELEAEVETALREIAALLRGKGKRGDVNAHSPSPSKPECRYPPLQTKREIRPFPGNAGNALADAAKVKKTKTKTRECTKCARLLPYAAFRTCNCARCKACTLEAQRIAEEKRRAPRVTRTYRDGEAAEARAKRAA